SLGGPTVLRVAERLHDVKLKALFSVSGFQKEPDFPGNERITPFVQEGFSWEKIRNNTEHIFVFNSDNDPYVPLKEGEILHDKLGGVYRTFQNRNHLNRWGETREEGEQTFPEILEEILKLT
ncbi:alpha/beta hydrolase, partial [Candidatus Gracilibacteria bacterium]|nr:alpha/beta hydrolase [Candidatus Gracilibacteria bacterium]